MSNLPSGWAEASLGELGAWFGGGTPSKSKSEFWDHGTVPWLSPKDMGADVITGTRDQVNPVALNHSPVRLVPAGSVAVVVRSGILERRFPITVVPFETTLNQDMKALKPVAGVDPRWVAWSIRFLEQEILCDCRKAGTTVASIEVSRLMNVTLPIPPTSEQRRIVTTLEDHLSRLGAGIAAVQSSDRRLKQWLDVLLASSSRVASEERSLPEGWEFLRIRDMAHVGSGATPLRSRQDYYKGGKIPWITSSLLNNPFIDKAEQHITEKAVAETAVKLWPAGTLLVAMYGEGKTRGHCSELKISATTNQACAAIVLYKEFEVRRPWVKLVLESSYEMNRRLASGGVQPNLSLSMIKDLCIPLPPRGEQDRLLAEVEHIRYAGEILQRELRQTERKARVLRRRLLSEAFEGRLAPQDPNDEPASVLLDRIRADRAMRPQVHRRRGIAKPA